MNSLAKNLGVQFSDRCVTVIEDFSRLVYKRVFFGNIDEKEFVAIEKITQQSFRNYLRRALFL